MKRTIFWFFLAITFKQLMWLIMIPPWQFPDEQAHFAQIQNYAENKSITPFSGPNTSREIYESEKLLGTARDDRGNNEFTHRPTYMLPLSESVSRNVERQIHDFPPNYRSDRVIYEATGYPPLYYILGVPFYYSVYDHDLLVRIFFVRLVNLPIFLLTIWISYQIGRLLFPRSSVLSLTLTVLIAYHPMFAFLSAGTNSDNVFNLLFTGLLYVSLKVISERMTILMLIQFITLVLLSWWSKPQAKLIPFVNIFPLLVNMKERGWIRGIGGLLTLLLIVLVSGFVGYQLISGQQFLPELRSWSEINKPTLPSFLAHIRSTLIHTYREVIPWYWGVFRWLSLTYPRIVHRIVNWITLIGGVGLLRYMLIFFFTSKKSSLSTLWFMIYTSLIYFTGLTVFDYLFVRSHSYSFGMQGRYLFPLIVAHMYLLLLGLLSWVGEDVQKKVVFLVGGGMVLFHEYAQYFVIRSYYPAQTISLFFKQASQYKPYFVKSPVSQILVLLSCISLFIFIRHYMRLIKYHEEY